MGPTTESLTVQNDDKEPSNSLERRRARELPMRYTAPRSGVDDQANVRLDPKSTQKSCGGSLDLHFHCGHDLCFLANIVGGDIGGCM